MQLHIETLKQLQQQRDSAEFGSSCNRLFSAKEELAVLQLCLPINHIHILKFL